MFCERARGGSASLSRGIASEGATNHVVLIWSSIVPWKASPDEGPTKTSSWRLASHQLNNRCTFRAHVAALVLSGSSAQAIKGGVKPRSKLAAPSSSS